jgi:hypothetical protein
MARVILTLILLIPPFCQEAAEIGFAQPDLLGADVGKPKVVIVHDPAATLAFEPRERIVTEMVARGVTALTGLTNIAEAWRSLVSTQDTVGVKVYSPPGETSGTRPEVAKAVVKGLLEAGVPRSQIIIWDRRLEDLNRAGFTELARSLGVGVAGAVEAGFDSAVVYSNPLLGQLVYGDYEFRGAWRHSLTNEVVGRRSYFSRLLTRRITRMINIAPLLNHIHAGVSGILYTVASACTDNFNRFETHPTILMTAVPEIYGQTNIADRVALNIVDALIGQYEGRRQSLLQYSGVPNQLWFSTDPVALDVLAITELNRIREWNGIPAVTNGAELYYNARLLELGTDRLEGVDIIQLAN